jgi:hypothetical protein
MTSQNQQKPVLKHTDYDDDDVIFRKKIVVRSKEEVVPVKARTHKRSKRGGGSEILQPSHVSKWCVHHQRDVRKALVNKVKFTGSVLRGKVEYVRSGVKGGFKKLNFVYGRNSVKKFKARESRRLEKAKQALWGTVQKEQVQQCANITKLAKFKRTGKLSEALDECDCCSVRLMKQYNRSLAEVQGKLVKEGVESNPGPVDGMEPWMEELAEELEVSYYSDDDYDYNTDDDVWLGQQVEEEFVVVQPDTTEQELMQSGLEPNPGPSYHKETKRKLTVEEKAAIVINKNKAHNKEAMQLGLIPRGAYCLAQGKYIVGEFKIMKGSTKKVCCPECGLFLTELQRKKAEKVDVWVGKHPMVEIPDYVVDPTANIMTVEESKKFGKGPAKSEGKSSVSASCNNTKPNECTTPKQLASPNASQTCATAGCNNTKPNECTQTKPNSSKDDCAIEEYTEKNIQKESPEIVIDDQPSTSRKHSAQGNAPAIEEILVVKDSCDNTNGDIIFSALINPPVNNGNDSSGGGNDGNSPNNSGEKSEPGSSPTKPITDCKNRTVLRGYVLDDLQERSFMRINLNTTYLIIFIMSLYSYFFEGAKFAEWPSLGDHHWYSFNKESKDVPYETERRLVTQRGVEETKQPFEMITYIFRWNYELRVSVGFYLFIFFLFVVLPLGLGGMVCFEAISLKSFSFIIVSFYALTLTIFIIKSRKFISIIDVGNYHYLTYCPHLVSSILQDYDRPTNTTAALLTLGQKTRRCATLPLPDIDHIQIMDGSQLVTLFALTRPYFTRFPTLASMRVGLNQ